MLDQIWDSINSNFREKKYIPFVKEDGKATLLLDPSQDGQTLQIPVLSYTQTVPILREEYDGHALVHFISSSMWQEIARSVANAEPDSYIRILSTENASLWIWIVWKKKLPPQWGGNMTSKVKTGSVRRSPMTVCSQV